MRDHFTNVGNPFKGLRLTASELREIAVKADVDPRSVRKIIEGKPVKGMTGRRIMRELRTRFPDPTLEHPAPSTFIITFSVTPECDERITASQVKQWAKEMFEGCDLGSVSILNVSKKLKQSS